MNDWEVFIPSTTMYEALQIIDDALCYHFEFKVENHTIYFREFA